VTETLSSQLRQGTAHSHTAAENTAFMKCFLKGIVEREPLRKLLADLYFVYCALEEELYRHRFHPVVQKIYFPELERQAKLALDLEFYYGENWHDDIHASEEGKQYCDRIRNVAVLEPALLVAHAYVRYMGDLSGGQRLKSIIRSALELPTDRGTGLYDFDRIPTAEAKREVKVRYRNALDSLPVDDSLAQQIVDEANRAFQLNCTIVHNLEPDVRAAIGDRRFDPLTRQDQPGSTERQPPSFATSQQVASK
jgi:heme oxygenase